MAELITIYRYVFNNAMTYNLFSKNQQFGFLTQIITKSLKA